MSFWKIKIGLTDVDFDTLGIHVTREFSGIGIAPVQNNLVPFASAPGSLYQSTKILPRLLTLMIDLEGSSYTDMHDLHQTLCDLFFNPVTPTVTPTVKLTYTGGAAPVYGYFHYVSGLEWLGYEGFTQTIPLQLIAENPYWI